jgi:hypothetical protein
VETRDSSPLPPGSLRLQGDAPPLALLISLGPSLRRLRTRAGTEGRKCLSLARSLALPWWLGIGKLRVDDDTATRGRRGRSRDREREGFCARFRRVKLDWFGFGSRPDFFFYAARRPSSKCSFTESALNFV